jgi:Na+-driven multidrug efflux pump
MSLKLFLRITVCATSLIGLTVLLFPHFVANFFLPSPARGTDIFIRFLGSTLIGYTYLNFYTSTDSHLSTARPTLIGNLSTLSIAFLVSLIGVLDHSLKSTGWLIVLLHLAFGSGFAWFTYKHQSLRK